jgi:hypothetical protein
MTDYSNAQQNNFALVINKLPGISFKCQRVSMPGFRIATTSPDNPKQIITLPGSKFEFDAFSCRFIVDSDLTNWLAAVDWLKSATVDDQADVISDFSVVVPNLYGKAGYSIRYIAAFPTKSFRVVGVFRLVGYRMQVIMLDRRQRRWRRWCRMTSVLDLVVRKMR